MRNRFCRHAWHRSRALENNLFALGIDEKAGSIQTENAAVQIPLAMAQALREQTQAERRQREQFDLLQAGKLLKLQEAE